MIWPVERKGGICYVAAKILSVVADETAGELFVKITADGLSENEILYTDMYYSQLDSSCRGLLLTTITEIDPDELKRPKHQASAAKFLVDCSADDRFLQDMVQRGTRLYMHYTEDGGEYIVLAKRMIMGNTPPDARAEEKLI
jgi:hypothetical protein